MRLGLLREGDRDPVTAYLPDDLGGEGPHPGLCGVPAARREPFGLRRLGTPRQEPDDVRQHAPHRAKRRIPAGRRGRGDRLMGSPHRPDCRGSSIRSRQRRPDLVRPPTASPTPRSLLDRRCRPAGRSAGPQRQHGSVQATCHHEPMKSPCASNWKWRFGPPASGRARSSGSSRSSTGSASPRTTPYDPTRASAHALLSTRKPITCREFW
jgi:hypothetical protein